MSSRCRCDDINRAGNQLRSIATAISAAGRMQNSAGRMPGSLSTLADSVYNGAYSPNGSGNADAIEALSVPVETSFNDLNRQLTDAQRSITVRLNQWQAEDARYHADE